MFTKIARICTYISIAAPLIATKSLFFPFITGKMLFFRFFTEIALVAVAGAIAYGEIPLSTIKNVVKKPIFIAISVFTGLFILSTLTAEDPSFAFWSNFERGDGAWQMIHYFAFFFIISLLFQNHNDWKRLISAQVLISAFVGLYGVGQAINWPLWIIDPPTGSVSGTLGSPAYLGVYMAISACFAVWIALQTSGNKRFLWIFIALFELVSFFMAQNRGSFTAVGISTVFMLCIGIFQKKRSKKTYIIAGIAAFLIIFSIGTLVFTIKGGNTIEGFQPRLWTWESAIAGVIERPLFGWGAENFPFIFDKYYNPKHYLIESWFDRAHNTALEYLTTGGIPLFLAYAGIFFVLYRRLLRKKNDRAFPFFAALPLIYLINGLALFETLPLYIVLFLIIAFITAFTDAFAHMPLEHPTPQTTNTAITKGLYFVFIILTLISLYATIYRPLRKNMMMLEAMRTNNKNDMELFAEHDAILKYASPVGNEEALQGLLTFTVSYFEYIQKNHLESEVSKEKIRTIMEFVGDWYEKRKTDAIGIKTLYMRATGLLHAYQLSGIAAYLEEADILIAEGSKIAPTRIEFINLGMASAALHTNKEEYARLVKKGKTLLPTLNVEPDMTKLSR